MSNNLNGARLTGGQANPETTSNDADEALDAALTETLVVDLTNSATVSAANYRACVHIKVTPTGATKTLTLQAIKKLTVIDNQGTNAITVALGTANFALAAGAQCFVYTDGTTNGLLQLSLGGGGGGSTETALPRDTAMFITGKPVGSSEVFRMNVVRAFTWPVGLTGSVFTAKTAATASSVFTIKQNGTSIGTITFGAASSTGTVSFTGAVTFAVNDLIEITAPATQDATLADISFALLGTTPYTTTLTPHDIGFFIPAKPGAGATVFRMNVVREFVWKASLTGSIVNAKTASAASAVFTIKQNGSSIGTVTFSTSATGTISFTADVFFAVNDLIEVVAPSTQDTALADIAFNLLGSR